jgi:hypothetical protein
MTLDRRLFLQLLPAPLLAANEYRCDVAVIGGGTGGCAAAIAACRNGMRVLMTEETDWVGGQLTSQCVPPDEHPWIESFGGTALYRSYRSRVREFYRRNFPLTPEVREREHFNPGGGSVSRLTHEPRVSLSVLEEMLAPWIGGGQLVLLLEHKPVSAETNRDEVRAATVRSLRTSRTVTIYAKYFLDATEQGDLLPLTKTEYVTGFESRRQTGEMRAPEQAQPANIQAFTVCFAIGYDKSRPEPIEKPEEYALWRDYVPDLKPAWPGKLLDWTMSHPITLKPRPMGLNPEPPYTMPEGRPNLWIYRRIAAKEHFAPGAYASDISLVNWPQNDYWLGNLHEVPEEEAARHLRRAKQLSLSLLYWMQTEAPRPDGGIGYPGLHLRHEQTGTEDGLAKYPYIRESRRIQAEFVVTDQHVGTDARMKQTGKSREEVTAETFSDSVGVGSYRIDLHPSSGGDNYIDVSSLPFEIPLGSLIPKRVENLIPACKNLGVTHITNGCYRLHPVEWNIGESAGYLAAWAVRNSVVPRQIRTDRKRLADFRKWITDQGVETSWPRLTPR